jgi:hypothetical protein
MGAKMDSDAFRRLINKVSEVLYRNSLLDQIVIVAENDTLKRLDEGKWIQTDIRIDQANYGAGKTHAHIYGRKGKQLGVVNIDGSGSHNTKMRLRSDHAAALIAHGFDIRKDNMVEWVLDNSLDKTLLFG